MAQSRPPPVRTHAVATSPPPLSPRTHSHSEKKHHSRRKSGKDYAVSEKKVSRPAIVTRRTTPQHITKVAPGYSSRSHRDRDEEGGRDSGESFPQFCMTCEKQFLPANNTFLYCSEACRLHDQAPSQPSYYSSSPPLTPYTRTFPHPTDASEGPDIIPRFSPTQSRPRSYFNSDPYPQHSQSYHVPSTIYSTSAQPQTTYTPATSTTALDSLRSLATALPKTAPRTSRREPESPPKSTASSITRSGSGVWDYIPFTGNKTTPNVTPGNSYSNGGYAVSQSYSAYGNGGKKEEAGGYAKSHGATGANSAGWGNMGGMGMDRPLPPRTGPSGYGHRPRSIDLVTPFSGH